LTGSIPGLLHSQRAARMTARSFTMLWPIAILTPRSSFRRGRRRFRMRLQRRSAIGILYQASERLTLACRGLSPSWPALCRPSPASFATLVAAAKRHSFRRLVLQRSTSTGAWAGSGASATTAGAWLRLRCIGTRPSLTGDFRLELCLHSGPRQRLDVCAQSDDECRHAGLRSNPLISTPADRRRGQAVHAPKR
jgi:hypothetical protein